MKINDKKYWFILGNFPLLSTAEISAVLSLDEKELKQNILKITYPELSPENLIKEIGGTIKIGEEIDNYLTEKNLLKNIKKFLKTRTGKIHFGISFYHTEDSRIIDDWARTIKNDLKDEGKSIRFVFKNTPELSSVTVQKNNLIKKGAEFLITKNSDGTYSLARTLAVQPFEDFGVRDFGRPGRDSLSGMLPPKLAMMMINLSQTHKDELLLDPFCGSGTILSEAIVLEYRQLIGADISSKAMEDTEKNILWLKNKVDSMPEIKLFNLDANKLSQKIKIGSVAGIVAEPYLGKPLKGSEPKDFLLNQINELEKTYIGVFKEFKKIMKKNGTIVFIIPRFKYKNDWLTLDCQKKIEALGFKSEPLLELDNKKYSFILYHRANQRVGREIWKFRNHTS